MNGEVSRKSYKTYSTWDNRMQVVVSTIDGNKHVFNFINYIFFKKPISMNGNGI